MNKGALVEHVTKIMNTQNAVAKVAATINFVYAVVNALIVK